MTKEEVPANDRQDAERKNGCGHVGPMLRYAVPNRKQAHEERGPDENVVNGRIPQKP